MDMMTQYSSSRRWKNARIYSWWTSFYVLISTLTTLASFPVATGDQSLQLGQQVKIFNITSEFVGYREIEVYLPPGFNPTRTLPYPLIVFLHGYDTTFLSFDFLNNVTNSLVESGMFPDGVVMLKPDGSVPSTSPDGQGSFRANSELNGNYEDYLLKEVIPWAETNLNANTDPKMRVLMGHSDGGSAALRIGFQNLNLFKSITSHSGFAKVDTALISAVGNTSVFIESAFNTINPNKPLGRFSNLLVEASKAWSPDLSAEYGMDFPFVNNGGGELNNTVINNWVSFSPHTIVLNDPNYIQLNIVNLWLDVGDKDELMLLQPNLGLAGILLEANIPHELQVYEGPHFDPEMLSSRFTEALTYWGQYLATLNVLPPAVAVQTVRNNTVDYPVLFGVIGGVVAFLVLATLITLVAIRVKWHVLCLDKRMAKDDMDDI